MPAREELDLEDVLFGEVGCSREYPEERFLFNPRNNIGMLFGALRYRTTIVANSL